MTRINCVPVEELTRQHLIAEYRELPRVFRLVRKSQQKGEQLHTIDIPPDYVLGKGHLKFFYDKLYWLAKRHQQLVNEMIKRGYKPQFTEALWETYRDLDNWWWGDWTPTERALTINRQRIFERLSKTENG